MHKIHALLPPSPLPNKQKKREEERTVIKAKNQMKESDICATYS